MPERKKANSPVAPGLPRAHVVDGVLPVAPPCVLNLESSEPVDGKLEVPEPEPVRRHLPRAPRAATQTGVRDRK